jgi:hypothetical protein
MSGLDKAGTLREVELPHEILADTRDFDLDLSTIWRTLSPLLCRGRVPCSPSDSASQRVAAQPLHSDAVRSLPTLERTPGG